MQINLLILQLAVIFLPGIIWARLDAGFAAKVKPSDIEFFLRAFLFGLATYAAEFLLFTAFGLPFTMADLGNAASKEIVSKDVALEIAAALAIGLVLSVIWLYGSRNKWLPRILQKIGATTRSATRTCGISPSIQPIFTQNTCISGISNISWSMQVWWIYFPRPVSCGKWCCAT